MNRACLIQCLIIVIPMEFGLACSAFSQTRLNVVSSQASGIEIDAIHVGGVVPAINDFTLQRFDDSWVNVPIQFYADDEAVQLIDGETAQQIRLLLASRTPAIAEQTLKDADSINGYRRMIIKGRCQLVSATTCRLIWRFRCAETGELVETSCQFTTAAAADDDSSAFEQVLLAEVVFSDLDGNVFLGQKVIGDDGLIRAVSFRDGASVTPELVQHSYPMKISHSFASGVVELQPPLARPTDVIRVSCDPGHAGHLIVGRICECMEMEVPVEGARSAVFEDVLFRVSIRESNFAALRQDPVYWQQRVRQLLEESSRSDSTDLRQWAVRYLELFNRQ